MKIAIPVETQDGLNSVVALHFGHAPYYAFVNDDTKECVVIPNGSSHNGGEKLPPEWLHDQDVDALVCGGLGARAIGLCTQLGIVVYLGAEPTVRDTLNSLKSGALEIAGSGDGCSHEH